MQASGEQWFGRFGFATDFNHLLNQILCIVSLLLQPVTQLTGLVWCVIQSLGLGLPGLARFGYLFLQAGLFRCQFAGLRAHFPHFLVETSGGLFAKVFPELIQLFLGPC